MENSESVHRAVGVGELCHGCERARDTITVQ